MNLINEDFELLVRQHQQCHRILFIRDETEEYSIGSLDYYDRQLNKYTNDVLEST